MSNQGTQANKNGKKFELEVFALTKSKLCLEYVKNKKNVNLQPGQITMNACYQKWFGIGRIDIKFNSGGQSVLVECKFQSGSGSVAEKYPGCVMCAEHLKENETYILVFDVYEQFLLSDILRGCKELAEKFRIKGKNVHVFSNVFEYEEWLNQISLKQISLLPAMNDLTPSSDGLVENVS